MQTHARIAVWLAGTAALTGDATAIAAASPVRSAWRVAGDPARIVYRSGHYPRLRLSDGSMREVHSLMSVASPLHFGDYVWNDADVPPVPAWVRVDLARQIVSVFRGGNEIGTAVIIYGARDHPTPTGLFSVLGKDAHYRSKAYAAPMPYALRITADGVALHASSVRERWATHGCIGTPIEFARHLFDAMRPGDKVEILPAGPGLRRPHAT